MNGKFCKNPKLANADDFFTSGLNIPGSTINLVGSNVTNVNVNVTPDMVNTPIVMTAMARNGPAGLVHSMAVMCVNGPIGLAPSGFVARVPTVIPAEKLEKFTRLNFKRW